VEDFIRKSGEKLCAIGEIGLDFSPRYLKNGDEDKKQQREVFRRQIEIANELGLAV
jgi:TatD DNase family protein